MGRKRIDENEKKVPQTIGIKKKYIEELKKRDINISRLIEELLKDYLKM